MNRILRKKLLRDLIGLRAQVASTALLLACGVALLVSAWSAYRSLQHARDEYYRDYRFADLFASIQRAPLEVSRRIARDTRISALEARIVIDGLLREPRAPDAEPALGRFVSLPDRGPEILNAVHLRRGRLPAPGSEVEAVLHEGYAGAHGIEPGSIVTAVIEGHLQELRVVGIGISPEYVMAVAPAVPLPDDRHYGIAWIPRAALERLARMEDAFNELSLKLVDPADGPAVAAVVDDALRPYGGRGAIDRERQSSNLFVEDEIRQQRTMAIVTPLIFLGIASFLIHIILSRLVDLQRRQVATLKAIGFTHRTVAAHYLGLVIVMSLLGVLPGIALGDLLGRFYAHSYESFFRFPRIDFSLSAGAAAVGLGAGLLPALIGAASALRVVFRLPPAEAMRPAAPRAFRPGRIEALPLWRRVPIPHRIAWRNVLSRPLRLLLVLLGLSMATCVVVASRGWVDIVDYLLETQFQRLQREDISVGLLRPAPSGGLLELAGVPGVLAVEGYRSVPIRLSHQGRNRDLTLTGWPDQPRMRRMLDAHLATIPPPAGGLLLSRFFSERWGIRAGERVRIEVLEGRPRVLDVEVRGFSDDLVGLSASMRLGELWRILGESPSYNVAALQVDPRRISEAYVSLQERPLVAAVNLKSALYRGFEKSMGGVVDAMSAVLIAFSLVIAVGIIFNSVQSSFSERAWELASLRVLGFTRARVRGMLLAEVTIQVVASLAPGCAIGFLLMRLVLDVSATEHFRFPAVIAPASYALAMLTVLGALAVSALVVRLKMKRLALVEALQGME